MDAIYCSGFWPTAYDWKKVATVFNQYGFPCEKWENKKTGWTASLLLNCNNPQYCVYDENGEYVGAADDLYGL